MRRLVANLDAEAELAGRTPSRPALEAAASVGTLLRAFARDDDRLHLAAPLDPKRLASLPGLPRPRLESGPLEDLEPASLVLAWAETPRVAAHRPKKPTGAGDEGTVDLDGPLHEVLWRIPPPSPPVAARVHSRSFFFDLAHRHGLALPDAALLESVDTLDAHLHGGGAAASPGGRFVVKAPLSAAGRLRWVGSAAELAEPKTRRTLQNLFGAHGPLLFEPWMERTHDFGLAALVTRDGRVRIVGIHGQTVDGEGRFTGLDLSAEGLFEEERTSLLEAAEIVAGALAREGYAGPFGIDAYRHVDRQGRRRFQPLGEINARMTVGLAAHALAHRLAPPAPEKLTLGPAPPTPSARPLLHPGPGPGLWI